MQNAVVAKAVDCFARDPANDGIEEGENPEQAKDVGSDTEEEQVAEGALRLVLFLKCLRRSYEMFSCHQSSTVQLPCIRRRFLKKICTHLTGYIFADTDDDDSDDSEDDIATKVEKAQKKHKKQESQVSKMMGKRDPCVTFVMIIMAMNLLIVPISYLVG